MSAFLSEFPYPAKGIVANIPRALIPTDAAFRLLNYDWHDGWVRRDGLLDVYQLGVGEEIISAYLWQRSDAPNWLLVQTNTGVVACFDTSSGDPATIAASICFIASGLANAPGTFASFGEKVFWGNGINTYMSWDGNPANGATTYASAPKGRLLCVWRDIMFVASNATNPDRVWGSNIGDPTVFDALDFVDIGKVQSRRITALAVFADLLITFKDDQTWVMYDPIEFDNRVTDTHRGCISSNAWVDAGDVFAFLSKHGIALFDPGGASQILSSRLGPEFASAQQDALAAYGYYHHDRVGMAIKDHHSWEWFYQAPERPWVEQTRPGYITLCEFTTAGEDILWVMEDQPNAWIKMSVPSTLPLDRVDEVQRIRINGKNSYPLLTPVTHASKTWFSNVAHPGEPGVSGWTEILPWVLDIRREIVEVGPNTYQALTNDPPDSPPSANWRLVEEWEQFDPYVLGDACFRNSLMWVLVETDNGGEEPGTTSAWQEITLPYGPGLYAVDSHVSHAASFWRATAATAGEPGVSPDWTEVTGIAAWQPLGNAFPVSGTYTITFDGQTTAAISVAATAEQVEDILEDLLNILPGDVRVVSGVTSDTRPVEFFVTFRGQYSGEDVPQMTLTLSLVNALPGDEGSVITIVTGSSSEGSLVEPVNDDGDMAAGGTYEYDSVFASGWLTMELPQVQKSLQYIRTIQGKMGFVQVESELGESAILEYVAGPERLDTDVHGYRFKITVTGNDPDHILPVGVLEGQTEGSP